MYARADRLGYLGKKLKFPQTAISTLPNKIRVASENSHVGETCTVGVFVDTGSRYETKETNGVAHFLEHMTFKGTKRRTQRQLEQEIENMGAIFNAYTSRDQTVYYAKCFKKDVPQVMDVLADVIQNSEYTDDRIEAERHTILREMEEVEKQMEELIFDHLHETAYGRCSLGRTILGPEENIYSITRKNIQDYIKTHYTGNRIVVAGAGAVDHDSLVKLSENLFSTIPDAPKTPLEVEPAIYDGSDIKIRFDSMDLGHIAVGFQTGGWNDPDIYALMVMQQILGSFDPASIAAKFNPSPMIQSLLEAECVYKLKPFLSTYKDTGLFGVYLTADKYSQEAAMQIVMRHLTRLCYDVDSVTLDRAQCQLATSLLGYLDNSTQVCEEIGRQLLNHGRRISPVETMEKIGSLTKKDIYAAGNRFIWDRDHVLAAVGPIHELPDYNWHRSRTYHYLN